MNNKKDSIDSKDGMFSFQKLKREKMMGNWIMSMLSYRLRTKNLIPALNEGPREQRMKVILVAKKMRYIIAMLTHPVIAGDFLLVPSKGRSASINYSPEQVGLGQPDRPFEYL